MNLNKIFKQVTGIALAATLSFGAFSTALAAPVQGSVGQSPSGIQKTIQLTNDGKDAYVPNTSFSFTVTPTTEAITNTDIKNVNAAPAGFVSLVNDTITFDGKTLFAALQGSDQKVAVGNTQLQYDMEKITKTGVYRVKITEKTPEDKRDGITYSTSPMYLDLYVTKDAKGNFQISNAIVYNLNGEKVGNTNQNSGNNTSINFNNDYANYDLTVGKEVKGNLGDQNREFEFKIKINGTDGERYLVTTTKDASGITTEGANKYTTSGTEVTVKLKHGETIKFAGLTAGDTYTVTETEANTDGYTTTEEVENATALGAADKTQTVVNEFTQDIPTGLIDNILPFIISIAVGGIFAVIYFKNNKKEEELA